MSYVLRCNRKGRDYFLKELVLHWPIVEANLRYTDLYFKALSFADRDVCKDFVRRHKLVGFTIEPYRDMKELFEFGKIDRRKVRTSEIC